MSGPAENSQIHKAFKKEKRQDTRGRGMQGGGAFSGLRDLLEAVLHAFMVRVGSVDAVWVRPAVAIAPVPTILPHASNGQRKPKCSEIRYLFQKSPQSRVTISEDTTIR